MFKNNKKEVYKVLYFEGIDEFMQNASCEIEIQEDTFKITNIMSKVIVTLPKDRIQKLDFLLEKDFMQKYHNCNSENTKIPKYYFIITYINKDKERKYIAFWTAPSFGVVKLQKFVYNYTPRNLSNNILL